MERHLLLDALCIVIIKIVVNSTKMYQKFMLIGFKSGSNLVVNYIEFANSIYIYFHGQTQNGNHCLSSFCETHCH